LFRPMARLGSLISVPDMRIDLPISVPDMP
jgi:hypothetical protein